ncbi:BQ5605_C004g02976 [Microbotryum silenes-dioicae]|uniref:BQ5605_C004g02976 protein n=1 Tax=Microbotryum silenes-dioicae TaxID=796604 RepID=A0A2X0PBD5_9BASI|nr:BQ5605_C004g02976 [Microbotryum silenes-dioicae]
MPSRIQLVISTLACASLNDPHLLPLGLGLGSSLGVHAAPARAPTTPSASTPQASEAAQAFQSGQLLQDVVPTSLLATGDGMTYGNVSVQTAGDTASRVLRWQASGVLTRDGCPAGVNITDCYFLRLDGAGNLQSASASSRRRRRSNLDGTNFAIEQDPNVDFDAEEEFFVEIALRQPNLRVACSAVDGGSTPLASPTMALLTAMVTTAASATTTPRISSLGRQRIEFLTWPPYDAGSNILSSWRTYQSVATKTSTRFFHAWHRQTHWIRILRRDGCGGPVVTLDYSSQSSADFAQRKAAVLTRMPTDDEARITDLVRDCNPCVSVPISTFFGKTVQHNLFVTFGEQGRLA